MEPSAPASDDPFWQRLDDHERDLFRDYVQMLIADPEAIADERWNPDRRQEFFRLLRKGLGL